MPGSESSPRPGGSSSRAGWAAARPASAASSSCASVDSSVKATAGEGVRGHAPTDAGCSPHCVSQAGPLGEAGQTQLRMPRKRAVPDGLRRNGGWADGAERGRPQWTVTKVRTLQGARATPRAPLRLCLSGDLRSEEKRVVSLCRHEGPRWECPQGRPSWDSPSWSMPWRVAPGGMHTACAALHRQGFGAGPRCPCPQRSHTHSRCTCPQSPWGNRVGWHTQPWLMSPLPAQGPRAPGNGGLKPRCLDSGSTTFRTMKKVEMRSPQTTSSPVPRPTRLPSLLSPRAAPG